MHLLISNVEFVSCTKEQRICYKGQEYVFLAFRLNYKIEDLWRQYSGEKVGERKLKKQQRKERNNQRLSFYSFYVILKALCCGRTKQHAGGNKLCIH